MQKIREICLKMPNWVQYCPGFPIKFFHLSPILDTFCLLWNVKIPWVKFRFISGVGGHLREASVTFDKFHAIQALNKARGEVRRTGQKHNPLLIGSRYIWLKNPENLTAKQKGLLETLRYENLKTAKVYQMKLTFQDIYRTIREPEAAEAAIKKWLAWAVRSRLEPIKIFAKTVKSHFDGILGYFTSGLASGTMGGINSRIQEIKRRARGFRNIGDFITMIYLEAAGLDIELPT
jgi:transposase